MRDELLGLGAALGALGLVYRLHHTRTESRRKEAKDLIARIVSSAQCVEALAIEYQLVQGTDSTCAAKGEEIRKQFKQLGLMVTEFRQLSDDRTLAGALIRFRQKATGNLDQRLRVAVTRDDPTITDIEDSCRVFCTTAHTVCHSRFK